MKPQASNIKNYTRGGQITLHNIRMFLQITNKLTFIGLLIFISITGLVAFFTTTFYERYVCTEYTWSTFIPALNPEAGTEFKLPHNKMIKLKYNVINQSPVLKAVCKNVLIKLIRAMIVSLLITIITLTATTIWLRRRGESQTEDLPLKGDEFVNKNTLKNIIINRKLNSDLTLAGLPLIKGSETRHFFLHGTTGSGKSQGIKELLAQIRIRGDRAIIYDMSCSYLEEYYDPTKDIILNPLDDRGQSWNLWDECRDSADYDSLAAAQIPMPVSTQDPFWINAARTIFSSAAFQMRNDPDRSVIKLLRYLLTADLEMMENYLKGTEAETLTSRKTEKTAISIKSVLATYLKSMKYIKDEINPFSIRKWVGTESANNWLFISSIDDRNETLKPLITAWLDIATNSMMSLPPSQTRRIWLILDEVTSLNRLPYLIKSAAKARKFGGCIVVGAQNFSEIEEQYGQQGATALSSLLNTRLFFRQPDPKMAKWSASNFGESIVEEVREGISYGANSIRDGISINRDEKVKPLVSFSEFMSLNELYAYIRLPGKFPISLVDFKLNIRPSKHPGIVPRNIDNAQLKDINQLIEKYEKPSITASEEHVQRNNKRSINKSKNNIVPKDHALDIDVR